METRHRTYAGDASAMAAVDDDAVDLVVTSPPYPMIELWDEQFAAQSASVAAALDADDGDAAFGAMHAVLDSVWEEVARVVRPGGIAAVVVGDATRTFGDRFRVYPNHARVIEAFESLGFDPLPDVLWRKPTNGAAKFMGSGMLPPNAYVTLEHEHVLVFRNGERPRSFEPGATQRYESAYFWEERNRWFSDVWTDVRGARQGRSGNVAAGADAGPGAVGGGSEPDAGAVDAESGADGIDAGADPAGDDAVSPSAVEDETDADADAGEDRDRSAAYPFEIPYRLICMYSVYGDTVLDPFLGTGTTTLAAMVAGRDSVGYELDPSVLADLDDRVGDLPERSERVVTDRLDAHRAFVERRRAEGETFEYEADHYDFPVRTRQEREIRLRVVDEIRPTADGYRVTYESG